MFTGPRSFIGFRLVGPQLIDSSTGEAGDDHPWQGVRKRDDAWGTARQMEDMLETTAVLRLGGAIEQVEHISGVRRQLLARRTDQVIVSAWVLPANATVAHPLRSGAGRTGTFAWEWL